MKKHEPHPSHPRQIRQRSAALVRVNEALAAEIRERWRVDRARQALSRCNQALIRADDEPQFLREALPRHRRGRRLSPLLGRLC